MRAPARYKYIRLCRRHVNLPLLVNTSMPISSEERSEVEADTTSSASDAAGSSASTANEKGAHHRPTLLPTPCQLGPRSSECNGEACVEMEKEKSPRNCNPAREPAPPASRGEPLIPWRPWHSLKLRGDGERENVEKTSARSNAAAIKSDLANQVTRNSNMIRMGRARGRRNNRASSRNNWEALCQTCWHAMLIKSKTGLHGSALPSCG